MITLNTTQQKFVDEATEAMSVPGLYTLCGYAGTGKTSCLAHLYDIDPELIFLTPTHKAKGVLKSKLGAGAIVMTTTAYTKSFEGTKLDRMQLAWELAETEAERDKIDKRIIKLKKSGDAQQPVFGDRSRPPELDGMFLKVVVDEASMVTRDDRNKIMANVDAALFVGDGFQLPPVTKQGEQNQDWFANHRHNWIFEEVVRQSKESGILTLATAVRQATERFELHQWVHDNRKKFGDVFMIDESPRMLKEIAKESAVALSFMNYVVDELSYSVRRVLGHDEHKVIPEDKLYASNNFADYQNKDELSVKSDMTLGKQGSGVWTVRNLTQNFEQVVMVNDAHLVADMENADRKEKRSERGLLIRFDYARTVHSSQGSEWDTVVYKHQGNDYLDEETDNRLVYTAITRASRAFALIK